MDCELHRIEALPGDGRYVLTFRRADGGDQSAVAQVSSDGAGLEVAESALPPGWSAAHPAFADLVAATLALDRARSASRPPSGSLRDVEGGWDVGLGNVVLDANGTPSCFAHGPMEQDGARWTCAECGAQALLD